MRVFKPHAVRPARFISLALALFITALSVPVLPSAKAAEIDDSRPYPAGIAVMLLDADGVFIPGYEFRLYYASESGSADKSRPVINEDGDQIILKNSTGTYFFPDTYKNGASGSWSLVLVETVAPENYKPSQGSEYPLMLKSDSSGALSFDPVSETGYITEYIDIPGIVEITVYNYEPGRDPPADPDEDNDEPDGGDDDGIPGEQPGGDVGEGPGVQVGESGSPASPNPSDPASGSTGQSGAPSGGAGVPGDSSPGAGASQSGPNNQDSSAGRQESSAPPAELPYTGGEGFLILLPISLLFISLGFVFLKCRG